MATMARMPTMTTMTTNMATLTTRLEEAGHVLDADDVRAGRDALGGEVAVVGHVVDRARVHTASDGHIASWRSSADDDDDDDDAPE